MTSVHNFFHVFFYRKTFSERILNGTRHHNKAQHALHTHLHMIRKWSYLCMVHVCVCNVWNENGNGRETSTFFQINDCNYDFQFCDAWTKSGTKNHQQWNPRRRASEQARDGEINDTKFRECFHCFILVSSFSVGRVLFVFSAIEFDVYRRGTNDRPTTIYTLLTTTKSKITIRVNIYGA